VPAQPARKIQFMSPIELFHEARLTDAIAAQTAVVDRRQDDISERLLLCDLLAFTGDRDAVRRQLEFIADPPPELQAYITEWRELLAADESRHAGTPPTLIGKKSEHVRRRLEAIQKLHDGDEDGAIDLIDAADESAPWVEGFLDGRPFEGWRDSDDLIGPILEAFAGGKFLWIPIEQIRKLRLDEPQSIRDHLYRPATLLLVDGSELEALIPTLYVGTADHPEEGIRAGAGIDWVERNGLVRGVGSRTFLFGEEELSLSEFRQVEVRRQ
jgi:type VI secretion system protein ImpE